MARLKAPLLSLGASGTIGKALVFASWKGIDYARVHVIPANPNTAGQQEVRGVFSTLNEMWKRMPQLARDPFVYAVRGQPLTPRNKHIQLNVAALQGQTDMDNLVMGVSSGSAIPFATAPGVDGTDGTITCTATPGVAPTGYTLSQAVGAACLDGDPSPVLTVTTTIGDKSSEPYTFAVTVATDDTYQFACWPIYTRTSDGVKFAGAPTRSQVVVTGH